MYSQDGFGLGHLRRTHSIAAALVRRCPEAAVLTVSDSRLGEFFEPTPNHEYVKLPSIVKVDRGVWRPVALPVPFDDVCALRRDILRSVASSYRPDVLIVDHMPHGAMGELVPTLEVLRRAGARIVLGLRDIVDAAPTVRERWAQEGAYDAMEAYYDRVLVYGQRDVFDAAAEYAFPAAVAARTAFTGYVCTPEEPRYGHRLRGELLGAQRGASLVVATAGGGADAYPLMSALIGAVPSVQARRHCLFVIVAGPFMPVDERRDLQQRARGLPVRVRITVSDALSYLQAADLVVAMTGYNTTMELLRSRTPAVVVPRWGPSAEQRMRAQLFAARGWFDAVDPDDLTSAVLADRIVDRLSHEVDHPEPATRPDLGGLTTAAEELAGLLELPARAPAHRGPPRHAPTPTQSGS
jgi:predicted glycosyltransferase